MIGGKKIALNTLFLMLSSVVNVAISLFTTAIIARNIGPELYGRYTFGLTFILMFSILANFGLESLFIRETARDRSNLRIINEIFHLKIVLAVFTIVSIVVSAHILNYPFATIQVLYILCAGLFFQILSESLLSVYRSIEKMHVTALFSILFRVVSAVIIVVAVYSGIGFFGIVSAYSVGNAIVFGASFALVHWQFRPLHLRSNMSAWAALIKQGIPFYLSALLTMFYTRINIIILSKLVSERDIGYYMAALNLVENLYFIPNAFNTSVFPAFSRLYGSSVEALQKGYARMTKYLIILTAAVAAGTILVSEQVIILIYGKEFIASVPVLNVLIFLWVFTFFSNTQSSLLFSIHKERTQVKIMLAATVVNIILNIILIRGYGYIGAAYASVLTEGIVVAMITATLWRLRFQYMPEFYLLRLAFVLIAMVASVKLLLEFNVVAAIAGGAFSYIGCLFLMRVFDSDDIYYMKSFVRRKTGSE